MPLFFVYKKKDSRKQSILDFYWQYFFHLPIWFLLLNAFLGLLVLYLLFFLLKKFHLSYKLFQYYFTSFTTALMQRLFTMLQVKEKYSLLSTIDQSLKNSNKVPLSTQSDINDRDRNHNEFILVANLLRFSYMQKHKKRVNEILKLQPIAFKDTNAYKWSCLACNPRFP